MWQWKIFFISSYCFTDGVCIVQPWQSNCSLIKFSLFIVREYWITNFSSEVPRGSSQQDFSGAAGDNIGQTSPTTNSSSDKKWWTDLLKSHRRRRSKVATRQNCPDNVREFWEVWLVWRESLSPPSRSNIKEEICLLVISFLFILNISSNLWHRKELLIFFNLLSS